MESEICFSKSVWAITIITSVAIIACCIFLARDIIMAEGERNIIKSSFLSLILITYFASIYFMPKNLSLTKDSVVIQCMIHKVEIPLTKISSIEIANKHKESDIRLFGSGGLWGYTGLFHNSKKGKYIAYVGNPKQSFYITLNSGKTYLVSCKGYRLFCAEIASLLQLKKSSR